MTEELETLQTKADFDLMTTFMVCGPLLGITPRGRKLLRELGEIASTRISLFKSAVRREEGEE